MDTDKTPSSPLFAQAEHPGRRGAPGPPLGAKETTRAGGDETRAAGPLLGTSGCLGRRASLDFHPAVPGERLGAGFVTCSSQGEIPAGARGAAANGELIPEGAAAAGAVCFRGLGSVSTRRRVTFCFFFFFCLLRVTPRELCQSGCSANVSGSSVRWPGRRRCAGPGWVLGGTGSHHDPMGGLPKRCPPGTSVPRGVSPGAECSGSHVLLQHLQPSCPHRGIRCLLLFSPPLPRRIDRSPLPGKAMLLLAPVPAQRGMRWAGHRRRAAAPRQQLGSRWAISVHPPQRQSGRLQNARDVCPALLQHAFRVRALRDRFFFPRRLAQLVLPVPGTDRGQQLPAEHLARRQASGFLGFNP